jgi:ATP-dependent helicase/nuclease subunit B
MSSPGNFRRHFLPWDRPWLPQVAAWLARDWKGAGPLDLSHVLAIVPTRQSGRRLREALAEHAATRGAAVFAPRAQTPDTLLSAGADAPDVASKLEALLAWTDVLRHVDLATMPQVFPVAPPSRDFAWAWQLAGNFFRLQTQLTEGGLGFADVIARAGADFPEAERWQQLAQLEQLQAERLAVLGKREPHAARRAFAQRPLVPIGIERIVLLASPDPLPLAIGVLEQWAREIPVDVVIYASHEETDAFDAVGRPLASIWEHRVLELSDFERRVHLCADPTAEAERAAEVARRYEQPDGIVAFGLADPEVLPLLENELSRAGLASYNPEGRLRRGERLYGLLSALAAIAREPTFDAVSTLARCPDFLAALRTRFRDVFSPASFLTQLDELHARYLPADLADAQRAASDFVATAAANTERGRARASLRDALAFVAALHGTLTQGAFPQNAIAALQTIFADRRFELSRGEDAEAVDAAEAWREIMGTCAAAAEQFDTIRVTEWWEVALRLFGEGRRTEEKSPGALELQGWLELLWEDAPHLVVAGFNDGLVPDAIVGDAFLPEVLRARLGLKTNHARFARDAYLLQAIAAWRTRATTSSSIGRLDLLFAKTSASGDPLRPSRLLLRCRDAELPARIAFLFRPAESVRPNLPWRRAWKLVPRREPPPTHVRVTALRTWLTCPFRFYLQQVLEMEPVDPAKSELDARDFGTLCHAALEAMAREPALRHCTDEKMLREFLLVALERAARARFGEVLTLPLVVQLESARQRLAKAAVVQAREREAGWIIERVESPFSIDVGGLDVRGKIDRIDRHEPSGAWRVLDYKTSDTATPPQKSHLRSFRAGDERLPEWMRVTLGGRDYVWADLQLPVYLRALATEGFRPEALTCGYLNLPKAIGETGLTLWNELEPELLAAAHACTDGVAAAIRAGEFWPPAEIPPDRDPFAALFHHGAEDSVEWNGVGVLAQSIAR